MIKAKQIVKVLGLVFNALWYINVILAGSAILFQLINIVFHKDLMLSANFLGLFKVDVSNAGTLNLSNGGLNVFIDSMEVNPTLLLENSWSRWVILVFSIGIVCCVLFYNYQLKHLFAELKQSVDKVEVFKLESIKRFQVMSVFSFLVFIVAAIISQLKVLLIKQIEMGGITLKPMFDTTILNMLWLSIAFYLIAIIFKIGLHLKQENELTI